MGPQPWECKRFESLEQQPELYFLMSVGISNPVTFPFCLPLNPSTPLNVSDSKTKTSLLLLRAPTLAALTCVSCLLLGAPSDCFVCPKVASRFRAKGSGGSFFFFFFFFFRRLVEFQTPASAWLAAAAFFLGLQRETQRTPHPETWSPGAQAHSPQKLCCTARSLKNSEHGAADRADGQPCDGQPKLE